MKKRGQGLSVNAIILIILAVVVLAVLIVGFTMGWDKIAPWLSSDNVDAIATQCEVACSTSSVNGYCTKMREMKEEGVVVGKETCNMFANDDDYTGYGVGTCPGLCEEKIYFWIADDSKCTGTGKRMFGPGSYVEGCENINNNIDNPSDETLCCEA